MSLIYRAIWQDDRPGLLDEATTTFMTWAREKHGEALIFEQAANTMNGVETSLRRAEVDGVQATEATLIEDGGASRWMTRQRVIVSKDGGQWIWVDVERTTTEVFRQQDISAPASYVLISTQVSRGEVARGWEMYFFVPEPPQLPLKGLTPNLFP